MQLVIGLAHEYWVMTRTGTNRREAFGVFTAQFFAPADDSGFGLV